MFFFPFIYVCVFIVYILNIDFILLHYFIQMIYLYSYILTPYYCNMHN